MKKSKILVTGSAGFIGGYLVEELLRQGHFVVGIDNYSKYGPIKKSYDDNPNYKFVKGDVKNTYLLVRLLKDCDYLVAGAAMIGGIAYFHRYAYDLLAENERITASTFDAAIKASKKFKLKKIIVISSSMVFESTDIFPTPETAVLTSPPPKSTYGFQKLSSEYFAKGAWEQYQLPYTIIRPFNCVGIGEMRAAAEKEVKSGNIKLALSHVVPDLVYKILNGQDPVHIFGDGKQIRHYTYGGDIAKGIVKAIFSPKAKNEDFNIATDKSTTVLELAKLIWKKINPHKPFRYISEKPFTYDVQKRIPDVRKAKKILNFEAKTTLDEILDEVILWIKSTTGKL
ncbi:MAG: NAD-dependent epimerase/dehydratase family protein [Microgenomates group bacterium]|nr:NAD-dependent epimerase/dehydratase family protein [Microgenomates group bacterium]